LAGLVFPPLLAGAALGWAATAEPASASAAPARALAAGLVAADLPNPEGRAADPQNARDEAKNITSRPEYQPPEKSLYERALEEIQKFLGRVMSTLSSGGAGSAFGWIVVIVLLGALSFLIVRLGRTVQRTPRQPHVEVAVEVHRTPTEWRSEAERFEAAGNWKEALRCRYRAMVADLVERDVVPDIPGRTVGEHRVDVRTTVPGAAPSFNGAAELFERAWYGDLPTGPDENRRFRELADSVVGQAGRS
jgi:hypothetical protein